MNTASVLLVLCVSWSLGGAASTGGFGSENDLHTRLALKHRRAYLKDPRAYLKDPKTYRKDSGSYSCTCGEKYESRIVGGTVTGKNEYPWMAAICYGATCNFQNQFCGGSLINDQYILTAAHCVEGKKARRISVSLGDHNLQSSSEADSVRYKASKTIIHPDYNKKTMENDIALIKLTKDVEMSEKVHPVCLPPEGPQYDNEVAYTTGWGRIVYNGESSETLREVAVKVLSNSECSRKYFLETIEETMLCAGNPGKDSCQGDSGGPLVYSAENITYVQIGVVSWGYECASEKYPGVYTRVSKYLNWIKDETASATYCPSS